MLRMLRQFVADEVSSRNGLEAGAPSFAKGVCRVTPRWSGVRGVSSIGLEIVM